MPAERLDLETLKDVNIHTRQGTVVPISQVRDALNDLAAGRPVATPGSRPFGCTIAYRD